MNRVSRKVGLTLSFLLLVPLLIAPHITTWNGLTWYTFINGEVADADQVNQNFDALAIALDVTVPNSFANSGIADANEINSNFDVLRQAVDQFTTDAAAAAAATQAAGSNACTQAGATWNPATSVCTSTAPGYNCYIGGFCARAAILGAQGGAGFVNAYAGHTQTTEPAFGAGCNTDPGSTEWAAGYAPDSAFGPTDLGMLFPYLCHD